MEPRAKGAKRTFRFSFAPGFRLPDLPGKDLEPRLFTASYFDTPDRALLRAQLTLKRRVEGGKSTWRLRSRAGAGFRIDVEGGPSGSPEGIRRLLIAILNGRDLVQVAKTRVRRSTTLVDDGSVPLAEVRVDDIAVLDGRRVTQRVKELRIRQVDGDCDIVEALAREVEAAGATPSVRPRLCDVGGVEPAARPDVATDGPARLARLLGEQVDAIRAHDPGTRLGADPEQLHDMRVATRRARAFVRAAQEWLEPGWSERVRHELVWLGEALGAVRDLDVFLVRLRGATAELHGRERRAAQRLVNRVERQHEKAHAELVEALSSERYWQLLRRLESGATGEPFLPVEIDLREPARREFTKLVRAMRRLGDQPLDEELHRARIRGKRARYAAELVPGKRAQRFIAHAKRFQDVIGEHQDAVVAEERLRALAVVSGPATAFAAGRLAERERHCRAAARDRLPKAWRKLDRAGARAWT